MAGENKEHPSEIIERLIQEGNRFSFVQAVRLMLHEAAFQQQSSIEDITASELLAKHIRFRPELSLDFPSTDIATVERLENDPVKYLITATFLGLYGASSPLPTFYTEDLIEEFNNEQSIKRDFIDIINQAIYPLFFKVWSKHRLFYKICEENDESVINILYSLLGLEDPVLRTQIHNIDKYFRYIGLVIQFPRCAEGLKSLIEDCFNLKGHIKIDECILRRVSIPSDQYFLLGRSCCTLGEDATLGKSITDITGRFHIVILNADTEILHAFLPSENLFLRLQQMVNFYVNHPLDWKLLIKLDKKNLKTTQPGNAQWSNLGWNTWLFSGNHVPDKAETLLTGN